MARSLAWTLVAGAVGWAGAAQAQDEGGSRRTRIALGPQLQPSFPGSDDHQLRPFVDVSRTSGDDPFAFEAPDESTGLTLLRTGDLAVGPSIGFEGKRSRNDLGVPLSEVGFSVELGGFVQYQVVPAVRLRAEVRQAVSGHKGLVGVMGADYVARDRDEWLFSIGPRVTLANGRYHRAYFNVSPAESLATGVRAFDAKGGLQAVGATAGVLRQLTPRWGIQGFAKYDRLVDDPGRSPIARSLGSRNQISGGIALSYTFGG